MSGNVVRASNQGLFANTHGFNLQALELSTISDNQAFDTAGAGFFVANSFIASAACNSGGGNGGGLVLAIGTTVGTLLPPGSWATGTLPALTLQLNQTSYAPGQTLILTATLTPGTTGAPVDAYVTVRLPDGSPLSVVPSGTARGMAPIATRLSPGPTLSTEILRYRFTGTEPAGAYTITGMLTQPGTLSPIGTADVNPFTVGP